MSPRAKATLISVGQGVLGSPPLNTGDSLNWSLSPLLDLMFVPSANRCLAIWSSLNSGCSQRPGSKNVKADALSRIHESELLEAEPETILPRDCIVGAMRWQIEDDVKEALRNVTPPTSCPPRRLFVPEELRSQEILVAGNGNHRKRVRRCLSHLCPQQVLDSVPDGPSSATTNPIQTMGRNLIGLCDRTAPIPCSHPPRLQPTS
ncbi:uncharacterized protein LOC144011102 [Festucalex cinctus]